jgi:hypothetical protein
MNREEGRVLFDREISAREGGIGTLLSPQQTGSIAASGRSQQKQMYITAEKRARAREYERERERERESNKEKELPEIGLPKKVITLVKKMGDFVAEAIC